MSRSLLYVSVFCAGLLLALACGGTGGDDGGGGGGGEGSTTTTTKVAVVGGDGEVRCLSAAVEAGPTSAALSSVTPCSNTAAKSNLDADDRVAVNTSGEAAVWVGSCGPIYVFKSSGLKLSSCRKAQVLAGNVVCTTTGSVAGTSQGCPVTIQTESAQVTTTGTWFTVTFDEETATTLVTVFDGEVVVEPFAEFGDPETVLDAEVVAAGQFYYTMPDEGLVTLGATLPRLAQPLVAVSPVIQDLRATPQFDSAKLRAVEEDIDPVILQNVNALVLRTGGAFFDQAAEAGGDVVATGVDWTQILDLDLQGGVVLTPFLEGSKTLAPDAFDPDFAAGLFAEIGGLEQGVTFVLVEADPEVVGLAAFIQESLEAIGFTIADQISVRSAEEGRAIFFELTESGLPAVMIGG